MIVLGFPEERSSESSTTLRVRRRLPARPEQFWAFGSTECADD